jgi:predicted nucleotidyltransferase
MPNLQEIGMGYVPTPREYEGGRVPIPSDFRTADLQLRKGLQKLYENGSIYGANIHGSTMHGEGGAGSDIDAVVVTSRLEAEKYLGELHEKIKDSTNVPVEFIPVTRNLAEQGNHTLDYYYALYIKTFCRDGIVGDDIFYFIKPRDSWSNPKEETRERISANLGKLSKMRASIPSEYNEEHCDFLEKILRQPIYVAIDMLRLRHGNYPAKDGKPLSKADCCEMFKYEFPHIETGDLFHVLGMRIIYNSFLGRQTGNPSEYIELLNGIEDIYPDARRFMERNLDYLISHNP